MHLNNRNQFHVSSIPHHCVEKAKLALELVEEARLFYINTQAQVSFNLLGPVIGALLILGFLWFMFNGMPSFLAEMGNAFSGLRNYLFLYLTLQPLWFPNVYPIP